jgi:RNA polymerase sigma factor (sigma-70 family)
MSERDPDFPDLADLKAGDEAAWEKAWAALWSCARVAASKWGLTEQDIEDVAAESIEKLLPKIQRVSSVKGLKALLAVIASQGALSLRRKQHAQKRGAGQTVSLEALLEEFGEMFEPAAPAGSLSDVELDELRKLLEELLLALDELPCCLLIDRVCHDLSHRELSEKYGIPIGTVGSHLTRGLDALRKPLMKLDDKVQELRHYLR